MLNFSLPLNIVSFGSVSQCLLRELYKRNEKICLFPIGPVDLSSYNIEPDFANWISQSIQRGPVKYKRKNPSFRLWHLQNSYESIGDKRFLYSFHETDSASESEISVANNHDALFVSSQYTKKVFEDFGAGNVIYAPLGIDKTHVFEKPDIQYLPNDVIQWTIIGKWEERKQTLRTIKLWTDKFGNNRNHQLVCLINNSHVDPKHLENALQQVLKKPFFNVVYLSVLKHSLEVNDLLNATDIFLSYSRCEGMNLPLISALSLGKTCVGLFEHVHKDYLTAENSILVPSSGKIPAIDNIFFHANAPFNSGNWYDCTDQSIYDSLDQAKDTIEIVNNRKVSKFYSEAIKTKDIFTYERTLDIILDNLK